MTISIPRFIVTNLLKKEGISSKDKQLVQKFLDSVYGRFSSDPKDLGSCSLESLPLNLYNLLYEELENNLQDSSIKRTYNQIVEYVRIKADSKGRKIKSLQLLATALESYIAPSIYHYMFFRDEYGNIVPGLATSVIYSPSYTDRSGNYNAAYTELVLEWSYIGHKESRRFTFYRRDLVGGKTVQEVLDSENIWLESESSILDYETSILKYVELKDKVGLQLLAGGVGKDCGNIWSKGSRSLEIDGERTKVVIDVLDGESIGSSKASTEISYVSSRISFINPKSTHIFQTKDVEEDMENLDGEGELVYQSQPFSGGKVIERAPICNENVPLPRHPYLRVFSLKEHSFFEVHVNNVEIYKYNTKLAGKLVLPESHKQLVEILAQGTADIIDDIIMGKSGGVIVLATGAPGVGKTLTAEVYSETVQKPLYVVQSSQLGISASDLEEKLQLILARAERWKAILLINEADVYIRERGGDLNQNAVVGVFLRVLEYFKGILFMTSNRATIIDDAIVSRATAHIHYHKPDEKRLYEIWKVHLKDFKLEFSEKQIYELVELFPNISGRDIRNMLKLSFLVSKKTRKLIDKSMLVYAAEFQDLSDQEKV